MINITTAARGISKTLKNFILTALYRVDQTTDRQLIQGNVASTGYITGRKCGVFSYLIEPESINVKLKLRTYIHGRFEHSPIFDFLATELDGGLPAIRYIGDKAMFFLIDWHCSVYAISDGINVSIGVSVDGNIQLHSIMTAYSKFKYLPNIMSGTYVVYLLNNDYVQLCIFSEKPAEINMLNFTMTIRLFYD